MTHPLPDKAVEAGARGIAEAAHLMLDRTKDVLPSDMVFAEACLSALAAEGLCVVPKEPTREMLLAGLNVPQNDFLEHCDNQTEVANVTIRPIYRAMIAAAQEG